MQGLPFAAGSASSHPPRARPTLRQLLRNARPADRAAVFAGVQSKPLNYTQLGQVFRYYVTRRRSASESVSLHTRSAASSPPSSSTLAPTSGQIQELLGYKHLDSTQRYTRVNTHELRGTIKRLRCRLKEVRY